MPFLHADFKSNGLARGADFIEFPGGSGPMLQAVESGEVDVAFALTDCIVAAIENGRPVRLAGPVITSPLTWGMYVSPTSSAQSKADLSEAVWGVSRFGSGSHVMVQVLVKQEGWTKAPRFEVCQGFAGLRESLKSGRIDAFLWEHFTARPYEESGDVRSVGRVPTPWGCFSAVASTNCKDGEDIRKMLDIFLKNGQNFTEDDASATLVAQKYGMSANDAKNWLNEVKYANSGRERVSPDVLELTKCTLRHAGVIQGCGCPGGIESYHLE